MSESSGKLPKGWITRRLDQVAQIQGGIQKQPKRTPVKNAYPFLRVANVLRSELDLSEVHQIELFGEELSRLRLVAGDLLIVEGNGSRREIGRMAVWNGSIPDCVHQNHLIRARLLGGIIPRFVEAYWNSPAGSAQLVDVASSTSGLYTLSVSKVGGIEIPVAPLQEQRRIVDEIDQQITRIDAGVAALKRIQANLKRQRAAILKAACEGRLVPTEAELARAEGRSFEPAEKLLERFVESQETRIKRNKPRTPASQGDAAQAALPEGWRWATIEQISVLVTDGDHNPPARTSVGIPHLTAKNVKRGKLWFADCSFVSREGYEKTKSRYEPLSGDLIVTCVGTVGETAIVPSDVEFSADRNLAAIRVVPGVMLAPFLKFALNSPYWQKRLRTCSGSTAQPHLYLGDLRAIPVPVCPIAEQHRIVGEVEAQISEVEEAERLIDSSLARAERLRQAVLRQAFEGKLVPQDPNDEPASALLDRLRAEQPQPATDGPKRRAPRRRAPGVEVE